MAAESEKHLYEKNNFCHPVTLAWFSLQIKSCKEPIANANFD